LPEELSKFFIRDRNNKINIGLGEGYHFSFHLGPHSGYFDIHKTYEGLEKNKPQETLLTISHVEAGKLIDKMTPMLYKLLIKYFLAERINLYRLEKLDRYLVSSGPGSIAPKDIFYFKNKNLRVRQDIDVENIEKLWFRPEELQVNPLGEIFTLVTGETDVQLGMVFFPAGYVGKRPYFVRQSNIRKFTKEAIRVFFEVASEIDIFISEEAKAVMREYLDSE
jgi:hypothetical protein